MAKKRNIVKFDDYEIELVDMDDPENLSRFRSDEKYRESFVTSLTDDEIKRILDHDVELMRKGKA